jgi:hypothetical protein
MDAAERPRDRALPVAEADREDRELVVRGVGGVKRPTDEGRAGGTGAALALHEPLV